MMSFAKLFSRMWPPVARARGLTACSCAVWAMAWASVNLEAAGPVRAKNVFLVTTDGLRWQELFEGAERPLIDAEVGRVKNTNQVLKAFWRETETARREALLPFFWGTLAPRGQVWGNPKRQSHVRVTNGHNFSYPGYNEFLTGAPDSRIDSNDAKPNPNLNVFQWLNTQPGFRGRQFAAVSWGVIPWVLNAGQTGIPVWSAFPLPPGAKPLPVSAEFQELVDRVTPIWGMFHSTRFARRSRRKPCGIGNLARDTSPWGRRTTGRTMGVMTCISNPPGVSIASCRNSGSSCNRCRFIGIKPP